MEDITNKPILTVEEKKAKRKEYMRIYHKNRRENDPEFAAKSRENVKKSYYKKKDDPEQYLNMMEKARIKSKKWYAENKLIRAKYFQYYQQNLIDNKENLI